VLETGGEKGIYLAALQKTAAPLYLLNAATGAAEAGDGHRRCGVGEWVLVFKGLKTKVAIFAARPEWWPGIFISRQRPKAERPARVTNWDERDEALYRCAARGGGVGSRARRGRWKHLVKKTADFEAKKSIRWLVVSWRPDGARPANDRPDRTTRGRVVAKGALVLRPKTIRGIGGVWRSGVARR